MNKTARIPTSGTTVLMALLLTLETAPARANDQAQALQKDLDELVTQLKNNRVDPKKVQALAKAMKKYDLADIMGKVYKPTKSNGIGYNPAQKGPGDSIEKRLNHLATKRPLSNADLLKERDLLMRMAIYNIAIHEVARQFVPVKPKTGKGAREWNQYNDEMKEGSNDLIKAVKVNNPAALKKAAGTITKACNDCHTDFR